MGGNSELAALKTIRWENNTRAVARDVNGDRVADAVDIAHVIHPDSKYYFAAYSGTNGERLWLSPSVEQPLRSTGYTDTHFISATNSGHVFAFKLVDGTQAWRTKFPERVEPYCRSDAEHVIIQFRDESRALVRLSDGAIEEAEPGPCVSIQTDDTASFSPEQIVQGVRYDNESLPGMSIDGTLLSAGEEMIAAAYEAGENNTHFGRWRLTSIATVDGSRQWDVLIPGDKEVGSISIDGAQNSGAEPCPIRASDLIHIME